MAAGLSFVAANAGMGAITALLAGGFLRIYDGARPATGNDPVTTQNLLSTLIFSNPAFATPANGVAAANQINTGAVIFGGTASWCRLVQSDGSTNILDLNVGTAAMTDVVLTTTTLILNGTVAISSLPLTFPIGP